MQGAIVCLFDRIVVYTIETTHAFGSGPQIIGIAAYQKNTIDMYISRLFIATDGTTPIHVFNAYRDDALSAVCHWTIPLFERLHAFSAAEIIIPPRFYGQSQWITSVPGLVERLTHFEWPSIVAVRDGGVDVLLSKTADSDTYSINAISPANGVSDAEFVHPRVDEGARFRTALDSVYNQINNTATTLGLPIPDDLTPNLLDMWCEQQVDPFTCATCIRVICDECPAFSEEHLSPLLELAPSSNATPRELAAIVRLDASNDRGIGITIDIPDPSVFVISYGGTEVGELLLPAIAQAIAPPPTAPAYNLDITMLK
jgi:hypothetical protein